MESTVVDISISPPSFKHVSLSSPRSPLSKTPKQVFFNPINIFDSFTHSCFIIYFFRLTSKIIFTAKVSSSKKRKNLNANDRSGDSDNDSDHDELRTSTTSTTEPTPLDHRQWFSMSDPMVFGNSSSHNTLDQTDMMMVRKQKN